MWPARSRPLAHDPSSRYDGPLRERPAEPPAYLPRPDGRERRWQHRRYHSLWSFLYGGVRPRRRAGRRSTDHELIFLDWHEPRVLYLVLAILLMSCTDALFTLNLLAIGGEELNAVMDALIRTDIETFLYVKIGVTAACVMLLAFAARRHFMGRLPVVRLLQGFCAGYAALIVYEIYLLSSHLEVFRPDW